MLYPSSLENLHTALSSYIRTCIPDAKLVVHLRAVRYRFPIREGMLRTALERRYDPKGSKRREVIESLVGVSVYVRCACITYDRICGLQRGRTGGP